MKTPTELAAEMFNHNYATYFRMCRIEGIEALEFTEWGKVTQEAYIESLKPVEVIDEVKEEVAICLDCRTPLTVKEVAYSSLCDDCRVSVFNPLDN